MKLLLGSELVFQLTEFLNVPPYIARVRGGKRLIFDERRFIASVLS